MAESTQRFDYQRFTFGFTFLYINIIIFSYKLFTIYYLYTDLIHCIVDNIYESKLITI